jgi:CRISPR/Cas system-associated endonuclease Cas1
MIRSCTVIGKGAPAFVFDMMEPERPKVDRALFAFVKSEALHPADFTIREDGAVRLNPELASTVSGLAARGALAQAALRSGQAAAHHLLWWNPSCSYGG